MPLIYVILGPLAALLGVGAIFFVIRHKSVQTKSMYSSRRAQIEHKVRSARARTLGPEKKPEVVKAPVAAPIASPAAAGAAAPTILAPPSMPGPPDEAPPKQRWDRGPTTPEPSPPTPEPSPPVAAPPPLPEATPAPLEPVWTPTDEPARSVAPAINANAGSQAWSIVGEEKAVEEPEPAGKGKRKKGGGAEWELAGGQEPGQEPDEVKRPSAVIAFAQYAVLVVGFVMVLIGVMVMIANSKVS